MRWLIILLLLFLTACAPAIPVPEPRPDVGTTMVQELGGVMVGETVLSGDYLLVTDLLIPVGSRLVIKAGTTIQVRRAEMTKIDPEFLSSLTELLVRGTLLIEGTVENPVVISPEKDASSSDPAWAGILLDRVHASAIRYAEISGAETGLLLIDAEMELADSLFEQNRYGLIIQGGQPLLDRNQISKGEGGLFVWNGATPVLNGNIVSQNGEEGLYIDRSSRPELSANRSEQNAIGLVSSVRPDVNGLQLVDNGESWRRLQDRQVAE